MEVLSLFDGMSCGQIAMNRIGLPITNYFASEINKPSIIVTKYNYPKTRHLHNICNITKSILPRIDLLMGGSPCQGFSFAGKGLNFDDPRSKLFFEYVRLLEQTQPKYFLLENVNMIDKWKDVISGYLGCQPIYINSKVVSAQDRKRLYWTNIPVVSMPIDKNISWSDICEDCWYAGGMRGRRVNEETGKRDDYNNKIPIIQFIESRLDNKTNCLTTVSKDTIVSERKVGRTPIDKIKWRYMTRNETERLQTVPDNYTKYVSLNDARHMLGNGWTVDVIAHILSYITI